MGVWEDENCQAVGQAKGLPTNNRQPILAVCKHQTTVEENSPDLIPEIITAAGQQKGQLRANGSGSSKSYNIIVEWLGSAESHTGSTTAVPEKLLIRGGQPYYTVGRLINPRSTIDPPDLAYNPVNRGLDKVDPSCMNTDLQQIFIRLIEGRHYFVQIRKGMSILELKKEIQIKLGTPVTYQNLIFSGLCLQDQHTLQHYGVVKDSTIILKLRL